jgi:hypothetical protein
MKNIQELVLSELYENHNWPNIKDERDGKNIAYISSIIEKLIKKIYIKKFTVHNLYYRNNNINYNSIGYWELQYIQFNTPPILTSITIYPHVIEGLIYSTAKYMSDNDIVNYIWNNHSKDEYTK